MVGLASLAAYSGTAAPSITWRNGGADSGDFATAAAVLGIPHPPGYPLFTLAAHLFVVALPWLEPARAVTLLCALLCAGAATTVSLSSSALCRRQGLARGLAALCGAAAALTLALGPLWWRQANLPTAHAGNVLFAALLCWVGVELTAPGRTPRSRRWALAGLLCGLAVSHHLTLLALAVGLVTARWLKPPRVERREVVVAAAFAVVGLVPWLALPSIAARQPAHVWGSPTTVPGFVDLVLGRGYWGLALAGSAADLLARLAVALRTLGAELGPIGLPALLVGSALLWESEPVYVRLIGALACVYGVFFALYAARDVESYLLPVAVASGPVVAVGIGAVVRWVDERVGRAGAIACAAIGPVAAGALAWSAMDLRDDDAAIRYARAVLAAAPPRAVVVADDDRPTFALWYAQVALGLRPDVAVVDERMLVFPWYRDRLTRDALEALAQVGSRPVVRAPEPGS